jgi:hypothetical protein
MVMDNPPNPALMEQGEVERLIHKVAELVIQVGLGNRE